jgi:WD40 repeat protein
MKDRNKPLAPAASRLSLRHTYMPKSPVDFAGPSHFGGKDDQLVLCAGKGSPTETILSIFTLIIAVAGDIHIWDRESGALLHHLRAQSLGGGDLTCIAWNPAADPFMFATGSHDGAVRIWTAQSTPLFHARRISGSVTPLSDTSSQLQLDFEPRAESSTGQQRFENVLLRVESPTESSEGPPAQPLEHTIVFSTPRAGLGGPYPTHL